MRHPGLKDKSRPLPPMLPVSILLAASLCALPVPAPAPVPGLLGDAATGVGTLIKGTGTYLKGAGTYLGKAMPKTMLGRAGLATVVGGGVTGMTFLGLQITDDAQRNSGTGAYASQLPAAQQNSDDTSDTTQGGDGSTNQPVSQPVQQGGNDGIDWS